MDITKHEGSKYLKIINSPIPNTMPIQVDVYAVLEAFEVTCPARAHAIKKLLCTGTRGKGDTMADLKGAQAAINRAIELEEDRQRPADAHRGHEKGKWVEDIPVIAQEEIDKAVYSPNQTNFTGSAREVSIGNMATPTKAEEQYLNDTSGCGKKSYEPAMSYSVKVRNLPDGHPFQFNGNHYTKSSSPDPIRDRRNCLCESRRVWVDPDIAVTTTESIYGDEGSE